MCMRAQGNKHLKLDPTIYDALQKERVAVGDVIYIEANSGAVKRVGRCDAYATEFDLEAEEYVPLPKACFCFAWLCQHWNVRTDSFACRLSSRLVGCDGAQCRSCGTHPTELGEVRIQCESELQTAMTGFLLSSMLSCLAKGTPSGDIKAPSTFCASHHVVDVRAFPRPRSCGAA